MIVGFLFGLLSSILKLLLDIVPSDLRKHCRAPLSSIGGRGRPQRKRKAKFSHDNVMNLGWKRHSATSHGRRILHLGLKIFSVNIGEGGSSEVTIAMFLCARSCILLYLLQVSSSSLDWLKRDLFGSAVSRQS